MRILGNHLPTRSLLLCLLAVVGCKPELKSNVDQPEPKVPAAVANREWDGAAKEKTLSLGTFTVESGKLIVSDPGYEPPKTNCDRRDQWLTDQSQVRDMDSRSEQD